MFDGFGGLRSAYGQDQLAIRTDVTRRSIKRTPTFDVTHKNAGITLATKGKIFLINLIAARISPGELVASWWEKEGRKRKDQRIRQPYNISRTLNAKRSFLMLKVSKATRDAHNDSRSAKKEASGLLDFGICQIYAVFVCCCWPVLSEPPVAVRRSRLGWGRFFTIERLR